MQGMAMGPTMEWVGSLANACLEWEGLNLTLLGLCTLMVHIELGRRPSKMRPQSLVSVRP